MKTYKFNEIENKHGVYIAYWSKQPGANEYEQYKQFRLLMTNSGVGNIDYSEYNISGNICLIDNLESSDGYSLIVFNSEKESILSIGDCYGCDLENITIVLEENNII